MSMRSKLNRFNQTAPLVDRYIGDAYPIVKLVSEHLKDIEFVANIYKSGRSKNIVLEYDDVAYQINWGYEGDLVDNKLVNFVEAFGADLATVLNSQNDLAAQLNQLANKINWDYNAFMNAKATVEQIKDELLIVEGNVINIETDITSRHGEVQGWYDIVLDRYNQINNTYSSINTKYTQILGAETSAIQSADRAELHSGLAQNSATIAGNQATAANDAANTAEYYANIAQNAGSISAGIVDEARKWASESEDVVVENGEYSSKHYAAKAEAAASGIEAFADKAQEWAEKPHNQAVEPGEYSALHHATEASQSASTALQNALDAASDRALAQTAKNQAEEARDLAEAHKNSASGSASAADLSAIDAGNSAIAAQQSENNAEAYSDDAKDWAIKLGSPVEGGEFSAKKHAQDAAGSSSTALTAKNDSESARDRSQEWAVKMADKVNGEDYSSKYYANLAAQSAYEADQSAQAAGSIAAGELIADDATSTGTTWSSTKISNEISSITGIPDGGTVGQILAKKTSNDADTEWIDVPDSGVVSVNGKTGSSVTLTTDDIGAGTATQPLTNILVSDIAKGVTAHGYGNHSSQGYLKAVDIANKADKSELFDGDYESLTNLPNLGSAAFENIPVSGNASSAQIVLGSDTRLTDPRTPTEHNHNNATTSAAGFMSAVDKTKLDGVESEATKNATDADLRDRSTHTGTQLLATISDAGTAAGADADDFATAAQGVNADTAYGWGDHASSGYATQTWVQSQGYKTTDTTYNLASSIDLGLVKLGHDTVQIEAAEAPTATESRTYALQVNSAGQAVVNVPWVNNTYYEIPEASLKHPGSSAGGLITGRRAHLLTSRLFDNGVTTGTLTAGNAGSVKILTGNVTVEASVFPDGAVMTLANPSATTRTITGGSGVTLILAGTDKTGSRTVGENGMAVVTHLGGEVFFVGGAGVA